ncbi:MAG: hypothetical protein GQ574_03670 [Crocinitomix sp.]|nr:hypothetical protein [Crocinitomix sp.]
MRALNIIGIIASFGIFKYGSYINNQLQELMWSSGGYYQYEEIHAGMKNIGKNGAFFMILIGLFFVGLYIGNFKKINRLTVKVISILGIIISVLFALINVFYIASGTSNSLPVMYVLWLLFGLTSLAFSIVLLVQAVRDFKGTKSPVTAGVGDGVIDDFDVI